MASQLNGHARRAQVAHVERDVILQTHRLTKRYGDLTAVDRLTIQLRRGEVYGLLGPNGSGKSTTVAMLLGLIKPTSGEIEAFGMSPRTHRWDILRQIGAIIESPAFYPYLSGRDNLKMMARSAADGSERRVDEVLERVDLTTRADDRYEHYSLGMKQRLGIASTLLRDPRLIILDEPTNGLDPAGTLEIRALIPRLAEEGRTVMVCSHLLHEVQLVCDRVTILQRGKQLVETSVDALLNQDRGLRLRTGNGTRPDELAPLLHQLPWVRSVAPEEDSFVRVLAPADRGADITRFLADQGIYVAELTPIQPTLESIFLELTGGQSGDV
ncbi:MAG TPA: ABC transporter ATP-binding protein [Dehalococcoidia bacterium]|nr:ABC transporter ATP-binding protein [Dehalococcoidia bacterium]